MPLKTLIIGKDGQLGSELLRIIQGSIGTSRREGSANYVNLSVPKTIEDTILRESPDVVINAAANTNVDACEANKKEAYEVNALSVRSMESACSRTGSYLIHVSTDYVFDGEKGMYVESDIPNPINYFGLTKLVGESFAFTYDRSLVIRTSGIYGIKMNFPLFVIKTLRESGTVNCIDSYYSPIHATMLALAIKELVGKEIHGILNISGKRISRYEFATEIKNRLKIDTGNIVLNKTQTLAKARRPYDSSLNNEKAASMLSTNFMDLDKSIEYLKNYAEIKQNGI